MSLEELGRTAEETVRDAARIDVDTRMVGELGARLTVAFQPGARGTEVFFPSHEVLAMEEASLRGVGNSQVASAISTAATLYRVKTGFTHAFR